MFDKRQWMFIDIAYRQMMIRVPEIHLLPEMNKAWLCLTIHTLSSRYPKIAQDLSLLVTIWITHHMIRPMWVLMFGMPEKLVV